jgi:hypothetical protein
MNRVGFQSLVIDNLGDVFHSILAATRATMLDLEGLVILHQSLPRETDQLGVDFFLLDLLPPMHGASATATSAHIRLLVASYDSADERHRVLLFCQRRLQFPYRCVQMDPRIAWSFMASPKGLRELTPIGSCVL